MLQKNDKRNTLFFRGSIFKVAELIFDYPNKTFHIRELTRKIKLSTTAVTEAIKELKKYDLITLEKTSLTTNIKANLESEAYRFYKLVFNLYRLENYGLIWSLKEAYRPESMVLFGSYAKGEDMENSDIDLLIITTKKVYGLGKLIEQFEKELNRNINLHVLTTMEKSSTEFRNTIANGIVLYGYVRVT